MRTAGRHTAGRAPPSATGGSCSSPGWSTRTRKRRARAGLGEDLPFLGERRPTSEVLHEASEAGGFAVFAHPWRRDACSRYRNEWTPFLSAVEIWNRHYDGIAPNPAGLGFARAAGLQPFVALDFHTRRQFFPLALLLDVEEPLSAAAVVDALHAGRFRSDLAGIPAHRLARGLSAAPTGRRGARPPARTGAQPRAPPRLDALVSAGHVPHYFSRFPDRRGELVRRLPLVAAQTGEVLLRGKDHDAVFELERHAGDRSRRRDSLSNDAGAHRDPARHHRDVIDGAVGRRDVLSGAVLHAGRQALESPTRANHGFVQSAVHDRVSNPDGIAPHAARGRIHAFVAIARRVPEIA